jgi:hypothetical protein
VPVASQFRRTLQVVNFVLGWVALVLVSLALVSFLIVRPLNETNNHLHVIDHGERTMATITSKQVGWTHISDGPDPYAEIHYTFAISSEQPKSGKYVFYFTAGDDLQPGDQIEIAYERQMPEMNVPIRARSNEGLSGPSFLGSVFLFCVFGLFWFLTVRWAWNTWRLY